MPSRRGFLTAGTVAAAGGLLADRASAQQSLDRIKRARRILLKGGIVLSLDPQIGDHEKADVLIEGAKILAVGPNAGASASSAFPIDATGMIVMPGFVDTHHHQYETVLRGIPADGNLGVYNDPPKNHVTVIQGILPPSSLPDNP